MISIYVLRDPSTREVRFVGKATNPNVRLSEHAYTCRLQRFGDLNPWLVKLRKAGKEPLMEIVAEVPKRLGEEAVLRVLRHYAKQPKPLPRKLHKWTEAEVVSVRLRYQAGESRDTLATEYDTSLSQISNIVTGQTWQHVGGPIVPVKGKTKITPLQAREIRHRVRTGEKQRVVAAAFGLTQSHVSELCSARK